VFLFYIVCMSLIRAVAAVIVKDKRFLAVKRKMTMKRDPGVWEFPGGKVEIGESLEAATMREVKEELDIECYVREILLPYVFQINSITIDLHYMLCELKTDESHIQLIDHDEWAWFDEKRFHKPDWLDGDEQIIHILKKRQLL
jgi:8-oxo-dGTP diphosphatase